MICQICNKEFSNRGLTYHITHAHNMSKKDYYDKFIKQPEEGICKICKQPTKFLGNSYKECCSTKCTLIYRYGVTHNSQILEVKEKMHTKEAHQKAVSNRNYIEIRKKSAITKKQRYGNENYNNSKKAQETNLKNIGKKSYLELDEIHKKGVEASKLPETHKKIKQTNIKNHGVECPFQFDYVNNQTEEVKKKRHDTRLNNGWNQNGDENLFMNYLNKLNIVYYHNYKTEKYPYNCDFYIPSLDLYIELNIYWTHCGHFFNSNDENDLSILNNLKLKSKEKDTYKKAIHTWTISDIEKRDIAIKNKLNYVVIWNRKQLKSFFDLNLLDYKGFIDFNNS